MRFQEKIVLIGLAGSGKTSLLYRYAHDRFNELVGPTIGAAFTCKTHIINEHTVNFSIWDTAGCTRYETLLPMYIRDANTALICTDSTDINDIPL